jgi:hypothetical protein
MAIKDFQSIKLTTLSRRLIKEISLLSNVLVGY